MLKQSIRTLAAALAVALPLAASAADSGSRQVAVHYSDLKLNQAADVAKLYSRLKHAASTVCEEYDARSLAKLAQSRICTERALDRAVADVNVAALSQLHAQSTLRGPRELRAAR
jgi:UrcA family protein